MAGVSRGMGGVTALPTRKYWPPGQKVHGRHGILDDWAFIFCRAGVAVRPALGLGWGGASPPHPHLPKLTNEAIALVLASRGIPSQCAGFDLPKASNTPL